MAAMKLLLSQARRQSLTKPFSSPFPQINRLFSSDPNPNPPPPPNESPKKLEPVSYAAKPSSEPSSPEEDRSTWTREEIRYTKDTPSLAPVSYAQRVAPLPEDRVVSEEDRERTPEEVETERKRIESENRARRRFLRATAVEEDTSSLPLPTLLKPELKHGKKPIFDLMEAIREIKVSTFDPRGSFCVCLISKGLNFFACFCSYNTCFV